MKSISTFAAGAVFVLLAGCRQYQNGAEVERKFTPTVYFDPATGCEYVAASARNEAALTPRMDASGKQICKVGGA